jgi:predicted ribosomally synthesized peptide with nif11-like leader
MVPTRLAQVWSLTSPLAIAPLCRQGRLGLQATAESDMSLEQLDAFLAHARAHPALRDQLRQPLEAPALLALAAAHGFALEDADLFAAQRREEEQLSATDLQRRAAEEARRLRSFIPG